MSLNFFFLNTIYVYILKLSLYFKINLINKIVSVKTDMINILLFKHLITFKLELKLYLTKNIVKLNKLGTHQSKLQ